MSPSGSSGAPAFSLLPLRGAGAAGADEAPSTAVASAAPCAADPVDVAALLREAAQGVASTPSLATSLAAALSPAEQWMARPPLRRYCRCGCGATCTTDADCGTGGVCGAAARQPYPARVAAAAI